MGDQEGFQVPGNYASTTKYIFPHGWHFLPVEKISTRGESYFQRAISFPEGGNFSKGRKCQPCGMIFSVMEIHIPMDLLEILPSPGSSVGRVSDC